MIKHKWLLTVLISVFLISCQYTKFVFCNNDTVFVSNCWPMFRYDACNSGYINNGNFTNSSELLWKYETFGMIKSSPIIIEDCVLFGSSDQNIYCLNASTGNVIWITSTDGEIWSSFAANNVSVVAGSDDGYLYCLDVETGSLFWKSRIGGKVRCSPLIYKDSIFVGSSNQDFFCINSQLLEVQI